MKVYQLWDAGVEKMKDAKESITPQGLVYSGSPGVSAVSMREPHLLCDPGKRLYVIEKLSDAILTDMRIFRIEDPSWISRYNTQSEYRRTTDLVTTPTEHLPLS